MQFWPGLHEAPHAPQLKKSLLRFTQESPQVVVSAEHMPTHTLPSQSSPAAHLVPQPPQFAGSLRVSAQTPPQSVSAPPHAHEPP
jgi:hypothetical protein